MIKKKVLNPNRVRHIEGGFGFIPHRFLTDDFLASLVSEEILLYFLPCKNLSQQLIQEKPVLY